MEEINVKGINLTITDSLRAHAKAKFGKALEFSNRVSCVDLEVAQENDVVGSFKVTALVHLNGAENTAFSVQNEDAYAGMNALQEVVLRSLRQAKRLKLTRRHKGVAA
jgi:ribosomal subunit interface protein